MKIKVSVNIDKEVYEKSKQLGVNVSQACTNYLKFLNAQIEATLSENKDFLGKASFTKEGLVRSPGFEPGSSAWEGMAEDWNRFRVWLEDKKFNHRYAITLFNYAQQYSDCLFKRDLSRVRDLPASIRPNILKALSALAKFTGQYEDWKALVKNYGLNWGGRSADDIVIDRLNKVQDPEEVWQWVRNVKQERPQLAALLDLMAVTGLRFIEGIHSYNLIRRLNVEGKLDTYYVHDKSALEHFRFKEIFLRSSKKAFVSFVPPEVIKSICDSGSELPSADRIQQLVRRRGLPLRFSDIREAHGTFMTRYLKESEINFLHGRVTSGVFMQHYFNPALIGDLKARGFQGIAEIQEKIRTLPRNVKIPVLQDKQKGGEKLD